MLKSVTNAPDIRGMRQILQAKGVVPMSCRDTGVYVWRRIPGTTRRERVVGTVATAITHLAVEVGYPGCARYPHAGSGMQGRHRSVASLAAEQAGEELFQSVLAWVRAQK